MMRRLAALCLALSASAVAHAGEPEPFGGPDGERALRPLLLPYVPPCEGDDCVIERTPELVGFERFELWLWLVAQSDWSTTVERPNPSLGATLEPIVNLDVQRRLRLGWTFTGKLGFWGDKRHGSPNFETGPTFRATAASAQDQVLDANFVWRPAAIFDGRHIGMRLSAGFGLRVARAVAIELTYEPVFGLDQPFEDVTGRETIMANGLGLQLGFNACVFWGGCAPSEPEQFIDPREEDEFWSYVLLHREKLGPRTCAAVREALNSFDFAPLAGADPMEEFLVAIHAIEPDPVIAGLLAKHRTLCHRRDQAKAWARKHLRADRKVKRVVGYAPTPLELTSVLGCLADEVR